MLRPWLSEIAQDSQAARGQGWGQGQRAHCCPGLSPAHGKGPGPLHRPAPHGRGDRQGHLRDPRGPSLPHTVQVQAEVVGGSRGSALPGPGVRGTLGHRRKRATRSPSHNHRVSRVTAWLCSGPFLESPAGGPHSCPQSLKPGASLLCQGCPGGPRGASLSQPRPRAGRASVGCGKGRPSRLSVGPGMR